MLPTWWLCVENVHNSFVDTCACLCVCVCVCVYVRRTGTRDRSHCLHRVFAGGHSIHHEKTGFMDTERSPDSMSDAQHNIRHVHII